ncbi:MAG: hypothetical protein QM793_10435 [Muricomes sp.]
MIKNNKGFTNYGKSNYGFMGWNYIELFSNKAQYKEGETNIVGYETIKDVARSQSIANSPLTESVARFSNFNNITIMAGDNFSQIPTATFVAAWDQIPKINAADKEFYEGQTVTREDLLQGVIALDKEDGTLTAKVLITKIQYAEGKGNPKQKGETKVWKGGMPKDEMLDTWFLQMDKDDSPVIHKITYEVTDSAGNMVEKTVNLRVKYNEFPIIQAEDRYFTLEEAQAGIITKDLLMKQAVEEKRTIVTDEEDDRLYTDTFSDKLEIVSFHPEEFKTFKQSGYVAVTYHIKDSMGKETYCNFTVHVMKDGIVPDVPVTKYVRFIEKKYYDLNKDMNPDTLTEKEEKEYNSNGGLNVDSKWYRNTEYVAVLSKFRDDRQKPEQIWKLAPDNVREVKRYVEKHGIGNFKEDNALALFVDEFSCYRMK